MNQRELPTKEMRELRDLAHPDNGEAAIRREVRLAECGEMGEPWMERAIKRYMSEPSHIPPWGTFGK